MGCLISTEISTRLGSASYRHKVSEEIQRKSKDLGTVRSVMEPLASYTTNTTTAAAAATTTNCY